MNARKEFYKELGGGPLTPTFYDGPFNYHSDSEYSLAWVSETHLHNNQHIIEDELGIGSYI